MKFKHFIWLLLSLVFSALLACASKPELKTEGINKEIAPTNALNNFSDFQNHQVLWGGTIISAQNLKQGTMLEILAYPLLKNYQPDTKQKPLGRFLAKHPAYLESVDYSPGRFITVVGTISEIVESKIGEAEYRYPMLQIEQHHLWPLSGKSDTQFHFGFGVMVHN